MRGFILLALVVCVGCSGSKPTGEEPVPVSKLASLQPYKRPDRPDQPKATPKEVESKKIIEKKQEKPIDQMKGKESKEVAKKTLSAKEKINEERYERERIRLAGLENEFALLDLASKAWIISVRRKLPSGDFKDFDDSDFAALRMFTKFFNSAHLLRLCFLCAEDRGLADKAIGYLKLTDDDDIEKFKAFFGSRFELSDRLGIVLAIEQAAKKGIGSLTGDQRQLIRPFSMFMGELLK